MPPKPIVLTEIQRQEVETLAALLNQEQIADYLGISRRTFQAILDRDPEVAARYKKGKAKAIAHVANGLLQKARSDDTVSSIFYLKTQAGWRETERLEHSGPDGRAIELSRVDADAQSFLDRLVRLQQGDPAFLEAKAHPAGSDDAEADTGGDDAG
jgi:predicted DNA-binding protein (UPF0251 family)